MTDYCLPPSLVANLADWTLPDYSGVQQSVMSGAVRTVSRGQRWQAHYQWHDLVNDDRARLSALMAVMQGKSNRCWMADPSYRQRGSFPAPELFTNGSFRTDASSWTVSGAATMSAFNRVLMLAMTGAGALGIFQSVALTAGAAYALRACLIDGVNSSPLAIGVQLSDTGASYSNIGLGRGLVTVAHIAGATGAANQYPIQVTSGTAATLLICTYASLRRCALASNPGAVTFYTSLPVKALPPSTLGLLRAGDRVEINGEMKSVTFDLNSDSTGAGSLMFAPGLRKLCPDNAPVIIGEPMMKGIMMTDAMQVTRPGLFSDFDLTFVEA